MEWPGERFGRRATDGPVRVRVRTKPRGWEGLPWLKDTSREEGEVTPERQVENDRRAERGPA